MEKSIFSHVEISTTHTRSAMLGLNLWSHTSSGTVRPWCEKLHDTDAVIPDDRGRKSASGGAKILAKKQKIRCCARCPWFLEIQGLDAPSPFGRLKRRLKVAR